MDESDFSALPHGWMGRTLDAGSKRIECERIIDLLPDAALEDILEYLEEMLEYFGARKN